mgnify:CR=1 FL=1
MAKKKEQSYLTAKESRKISRENRKITNELERKRKRKNVPESEYLTQMKDPANAVEFDDLHSYFFTDAGTVRSVDGVSFNVPVGKTVGVIGESGCGKSVTALSLMQLLQRPQGQIVSGEIRLNLGDKAYEISKMPVEKMQEIRLVNRAKWLLISELNMDEQTAHRYIEKQAMDRCVSRRKIAEGIIATYT